MVPDVLLRPARPGEGERLREIMAAAKASWGYERARVAAWAAGGDFSPPWFESREIHVAEVDGVPIGWAGLVVHGEEAWLDDLWVDPAWMRRGVGTRLFELVAGRARELGATRLEWEAEPNAVAFYERLGARREALREGSGTWGRPLPVMALALGAPDG